MQSIQSKQTLEKDVILHDLVEILDNMTSDWESGFAGRIGPETRLVVDLGFESIDVVELAGEIGEHFKHPNLPFQQLLMTADGRYVDDLQVSELVDFLYTYAT